jgi:ATP-dependent RNA helicase SUPV3L1/SUV3
LRLVLWSLWNGLDEFPESPPPGLVTIPNLPAVPRSHYTLAGYHPAGARALRIDMLERLADILRALDSKAGFEATPDMLSITGMSAEQFADLMGGLGYKATKGERAKVKVSAPVVVDDTPRINPITEEESVFAAPEVVEPAAEAAPEMESFYTYTWAPKPRFERPARKPEGEGAGQPRDANRQGRGEGGGEGRKGGGQNRGQNRSPQGGEAVKDGAPNDAAPAEGAASPRPDRRNDRGGYRGERKEGDRKDGDRKGGDRNAGDRNAGDRKGSDRGDFKGDGKGNRGKPARDDFKPKTFESRPARPEKPIDPDNPFAALMALKSKL